MLDLHKFANNTSDYILSIPYVKPAVSNPLICSFMIVFIILVILYFQQKWHDVDNVFNWTYNEDCVDSDFSPSYGKLFIFGFIPTVAIMSLYHHVEQSKTNQSIVTNMAVGQGEDKFEILPIG